MHTPWRRLRCNAAMGLAADGLALLLIGMVLGGAPQAGQAADAADSASRAPDAGRPDWVAIPASDSNMSFYLDRNSVHVREDAVEFWDVVIFRKPMQKDEASGRWIKEKRTLRSVRCDTQDQALLRGSSFDDEGRLIEAMLLPAAGSLRMAVRPGTVASVELQRVCAQTAASRRPSAQVPATPAAAEADGHPGAADPALSPLPAPEPIRVPGTRSEPVH